MTLTASSETHIGNVRRQALFSSRPLLHATCKIREIMLELLEREPEGKNAFELAARHGPRQPRCTDGRDFRGISRKRGLDRIDWRWAAA